MKKTLFAAAIVAAGVTGIAQADALDLAGIGETGNDISSAYDLGQGSTFFNNFEFETFTGSNGDMGVGDVDWFSFELGNIATIEFNSFFGVSNDPLERFDLSMQLLMDDGMGGATVIASISQLNAQSVSILANNLAVGRYFVGVSGYDTDAAANPLAILDGSSGAIMNSNTFTYGLRIGASVVPVPTAAFLGLGLLVPMGIKRRMNRRG